jgi:hypothetical protein
MGGRLIMPYHKWGDKDFDWKSLYNAIDTVEQVCRIFRIGVHSKEKYGTARWNFYLFDGSLHSITHPSHVAYRYNYWLASTKFFKVVSPIIRNIQLKALNLAFTVVCSRYPHIRDELISDAPVEVLPPDLALITAKMWSRSCTHCDKSFTTDNYICPHCGKENT